MSADLLLAIDQGTTSTRAIAYDRELRPVASAAIPLDTQHPKPGWVEQDPEQIIASVVESVGQVLDEVGGPGRIAAVGLDNQGETVVAWAAGTLRPLAPAIVWQCRRSGPIVDRLRERGLEPAIAARTGLPLDPYFSAGKLAWLLERDARVRVAARDGTLRFGTVDAWLTARLDGGRARTDTSTASRTQLLSLATLDWDADLLGWFGIERATLPSIGPTAGDLGTIRHARWGAELPLRALACDQQAALAGHAGFAPGRLKATYGTGVFLLANAGSRRVPVAGVETSIGWTLPSGRTDSVLQGGVFAAGTVVDWLRDGLGFVADTFETEAVARAGDPASGVRLLPALSGLGVPWWRPDARAVVAGLTPAAGRPEVVRAAFDGIAHLVADVVDTIRPALVADPVELRVDGGLVANRYLMERQADLLGLPVAVAAARESTALGVAGLAGIGAGLLAPEAIALANPTAERFEPRLDEATRRRERDAWRAFVESSLASADAAGATGPRC
ncbi:MAG TPA: FGGY family carbohydrate kinase [Candidatus Limnocylindrales bacterium]|nr:FGGY family carbohydrate kinase [Candidatus Limnocylindrales bacterium]